MVDISSFQMYTCKLLFLSELDISWDFCLFALGDSPGLQIYWFRENVNWCGHQQAVSVALWLRGDKFTRTTESCGGKGMALPLSRGEHLWAPQPLSQEECVPTLALTGFYWLNLHKNTGCLWKAHQSLSGSNNQIDNIQRTLRVYFESGSDS